MNVFVVTIRRYRVRRSGTALAAGFVLLAWVGFQMVTVQQARGQVPPSTLREAVVRSGFAEAAAGHGAQFLDEPLSSWEFGVSDRLFAAGYYLKSEMDGIMLGPLRVSVFDRATGGWRHAPDFAERGSVLRVGITPVHVILHLHATPSAGIGLVLHLDTLKPLVGLEGFGIRPIASGHILYIGNMVHFAPVHQERLLAFSPASGRSVEVFPGSGGSFADRARRAIREAFSALPVDLRHKIAGSPHGPPVDYDRTISTLAEGPDGRIAFVVSYRSDRMAEHSPQIWTAVRCALADKEDWSCVEADIDSVARETGIVLRRRGRMFEESDLDSLVRTLLRNRMLSPGDRVAVPVDDGAGPVTGPDSALAALSSRHDVPSLRPARF